MKSIEKKYNDKKKMKSEKISFKDMHCLLYIYLYIL